MLDYTRYWLTILAHDSQEVTPSYGTKEKGYYRVDLRHWAKRLASSTRDLLLLQALLAAQEQPKQHPVLASLRRQLAGFSCAVYAALASVIETTPGFTPNGAVSLLSDLQDPTKGLPNPQFQVLSNITDRVNQTLEHQPALLSALAQLLLSACRSVLVNVEVADTALKFSIAEIVDATADVTLPELDTVKIAGHTPTPTSVSTETLLVLSGYRRGVYVLGPYYALVVPEIAADVLIGAERTPYVKWQLVQRFLEGDASMATMIEDLVEMRLREWYAGPRGIRETTLQHLREELEPVFGDETATLRVVFVTRDKLVERLDDDVEVPDRRHTRYVGQEKKPASPETPAPRRASSVMSIELSHGVRLTQQRGKYYFVASTLPDVSASYISSHTYAVERVTAYGVDLVNVNALDRLAPAMTPEIVEKLRTDVADVVVPVSTGRVTFHDVKKQREAVARRRAGAVSRLVVAFSESQDEIIAEAWRPFLREDARRALMTALPDHSWSRICMRGRLLAAIVNAGGRLSEAQDEGYVVKRLGPDALKTYEKVLGGATRIKELA